MWPQDQPQAKMIGKYERNEAQPSIDAAKKIADALEVSLDYLVGEGINSKLDKQALKRLQDLELLEDNKRKLYSISLIPTSEMPRQGRRMLCKNKEIRFAPNARVRGEPTGWFVVYLL